MLARPVCSCSNLSGVIKYCPYSLTEIIILLRQLFFLYFLNPCAISFIRPLVNNIRSLLFILKYNRFVDIRYR